jgi:sugar phosphate isomerase/epimerase
MKLAFSTLGCPDWDVKQIATFAAKGGFDGVELRTHPDGNHASTTLSEAERGDLKRAFDDAGSRIFSIMAYSRFGSADASELQENSDELKRAIDLAGYVGADCVRTFGGRLDAGLDRADSVKRIGEQLRPCCEHAGQAGIRVAIETHDDWCQAQMLRSVVDATDHPALGVCWDFYNAVVGTGDTLEQSFEAVKDFVVYTHTKDGQPGPDGKWSYVLAGQGQIDLPRVIELLRSIGFDGFLSLEHEKKWHPELAEPEVAFAHYAQYMRTLLG